MKGKKMSLLVLAVGAIVALLAASVAYALWAETLTLAGEVHTGEVYLQWTQCSCNDDGLDPIAPYDGWPYPTDFQRKDVGSTTCWIDADDPRIMHFEVQNAYPSYYVDCQLHYKNTGTVPVVIRGYGIFPENFDLASDIYADDGELWIKYTDGVGVQMDPWDTSAEQAGSLELHVEQSAAENTTYTFSFYLCAAQWNEDATFEECMSASP